MNSLFISDLDFLTHNECNSILQSQPHFNVAKVDDPDAPIKESYRKCSFSLINTQLHPWLIPKLHTHLKEINNDFFRYSLDGITELQVIQYNTNSFYKKHVDTRTDELGYQRKITFVIQLSDDNDYAGGDLLLHTSEPAEKALREKGSIIVFPSFVLHEVTPILSGTRYSMIGWCFGPEFK